MQKRHSIWLGLGVLHAALLIPATTWAEQPSMNEVRIAMPPGGHATKTRRVVTGFDDRGKAVVSSDQMVENNISAQGGLQIGLLWGYDDKIGLALPDALAGRDPRQIKTNDLLMKWGTYDLPPGGAVGMHSTRTVDLLTMLEGELTMVLDSGEVVVLKPHDTLLQRGVVHAWQNRSDKPAKWTVVTLGRLKD